MEPLVLCLWIFAGAWAVTWLLSIATREYSWTDRLWSIIPIVYVAVFAVASGGNGRLVLMTVLVALWGARLTFNYARKGGYAPGGEDYRWRVLRERLTPAQYQLFNFSFISGYQNLILLAICLPAYTAYQHPTPLSALDVVAAVAFLAFLAGETVADQQQWNFHQHKLAGTAPTRFLTTGLFRYSRHPNYFFEQAQWWIVFAFGAIAAGSVLQWTVVGAALLTLLFLGSTALTESITKSKYPEYAEYQKVTSRQIPWFPRRLADDAVAHPSNG
jgi:steroid 5-alpha reductase family enzyme